MALVVAQPRGTPPRWHVLFALGRWGDAATLSSPHPDEPGTAIALLQDDQPSRFWGQVSPVVMLAEHPTRGALDVIYFPYALVPLETLWRLRLGDSLDERDGLALADASGNNLHAVLQGGASFTAGLFAGGLLLDDSGAQYAAGPGGFSATAGTWEVTARCPRRTQWLLYQAGGDGVARGLYQDADGIVHVHRGASTPLLSSSIPIPPDDDFHQVALGFDDQVSGDVVLAIDGDEVGRTNDLSDAATGAFSVGAGDAAVAPRANGIFDEVRFWPVVRTPNASAAAMARELTDEEAAQCMLYYRCNGYDSGTLPFPAPGVLDFTALPDPRCHAFHFLPQQWRARHLRVDVTAPVDGTVLRFGRLGADVKYQPRRRQYSRGHTHGAVDPTNSSRGPGAVLSFDPEDPYAAREFSIDLVSQEEMYAELYALRALSAGGRGCLVVMDPTDERYLQHKILYGPVKFERFSEQEIDYHSISVRVEGMP